MWTWRTQLGLNGIVLCFSANHLPVQSILWQRNIVGQWTGCIYCWLRISSVAGCLNIQSCVCVCGGNAVGTILCFRHTQTRMGSAFQSNADRTTILRIRCGIFVPRSCILSVPGTGIAQENHAMCDQSSVGFQFVLSAFINKQHCHVICMLLFYCRVDPFVARMAVYLLGAHGAA